MNPDDITLDNLTKSFEYIRISNQLDECNDIQNMRNIAKCFAKLYYKQQETLSVIGVVANTLPKNNE